MTASSQDIIWPQAEAPRRAPRVVRIAQPVWDNAKRPRFAGELGGAGLKRVVVDVGGVHRMSSAAFAQLLQVKARLMKAGGDLVVRGLHGQPRALCQILKLEAMLTGTKPASEHVAGQLQ